VTGDRDDERITLGKIYEAYDKIRQKASKVPQTIYWKGLCVLKDGKPTEHYEDFAEYIKGIQDQTLQSSKK